MRKYRLTLYDTADKAVLTAVVEGAEDPTTLQLSVVTIEVPEFANAFKTAPDGKLRAGWEPVE